MAQEYIVLMQQIQQSLDEYLRVTCQIQKTFRNMEKLLLQKILDNVTNTDDEYNSEEDDNESVSSSDTPRTLSISSSRTPGRANTRSWAGTCPRRCYAREAVSDNESVNENETWMGEYIFDREDLHNISLRHYGYSLSGHTINRKAAIQKGLDEHIHPEDIYRHLCALYTIWSTKAADWQTIYYTNLKEDIEFIMTLL